ncbi:MAG: FeoC-like transcriptional regulator [Ornithinibacter sp.]
MSTTATRTAGAGGPLTAVLAAFDGGAHSLSEVAGRCDLPLDTVRACVDHLVRMGRLEAKQLSAGCPSGGCGSCASGTDDGTAGCGSSAPSSRRSGPVLVAVSLARR